MSITETLADDLARDTILAMEHLGDDRLYAEVAKVLGASSTTLQEAYLTSIRVRLAELVCDGALVCTPAGSTAYNYSAHGPILPIGSNMLAMTPISAFRPRRWRGALLRHDARVDIEILAPDRRPVSASADNQEVRDIVRVSVEADHSSRLTLLFDPGHALDERILTEQFGF